jgi:hypothetical protein
MPIWPNATPTVLIDRQKHKKLATPEGAASFLDYKSDRKP